VKSCGLQNSSKVAPPPLNVAPEAALTLGIG
jgi:hypothetical protein